jgi:sortase A
MAADDTEHDAQPPWPRKPSWVDRPKHPHDWRWVVGGIGRIFIIIGVLMFLFVGYQLWGTGIQTARAQDRLENEFEDLLADAATSSQPPTTTAPPTTVADTVPDSVPVTSPSGSTLPPTTAPATTTTTPRGNPPPTPSRGKPLARLEIPRMGLTTYVVQGVSTANLKDGPGHLPETPMPGQLGNSAIAGHRTTYGAPFGNLDRLEPGDQIVATTLAGRYVYEVTGYAIVGANEYGTVVPTTDWSKATLTLITCHPKYTARDRLVVFSTLVATESAPPSVFEPPTTTAPPTTPGTVTTPVATLPGETVDSGPVDSGPVDTATVDTATVDSLPVDSLPVETVPAVVAGPPTHGGDDAFSEGWFSDPGAWPHVLAWGAVLAAVALGAYWLARLARRRWVGLLVGFAPFFFVLYFWFENINRLLPPNL